MIKCLSKYIIAGITREDPVNFGGRCWISSESEEVIKGIGIGFGVSENEIFLYLEGGVLVYK